MVVWLVTFLVVAGSDRVILFLLYFFCIAEEVLSRGITNLILTKHILLMASPKGLYFSSHVLYADDIFVLSRANKCSLSSLMNFLHSYGLASCQWINTSKSNFFTVNASPNFLSKIKDVLGCSRGNIYFNYLGVPTFVGSAKARLLQPLADKVRSKLASWKGKSLSLMRRLELINSVIYVLYLTTFRFIGGPPAFLNFFGLETLFGQVILINRVL